MEPESIAAYDLPDRVRAYDADMDLMHPNRPKMVGVALEVLPFESSAPLRALDLGTGTGFMATRFLEAFPRASVVAVDGAGAMVDLARARLGSPEGRVTFVVGDFRSLRALVSKNAPFDVAFSSYALHHLTAAEKGALLKDVRSLLSPGGWFVNADLVVSASAKLEERIQALRVRGIVSRAAGRDLSRSVGAPPPTRWAEGSRFETAAATRTFLDELEAREGDQPLPLQRDLAILREAGFKGVEVFWREYREAVYGGPAEVSE